MRKLLRAVADLHTRGFQRLRIFPYIGGPGAWRCVIVPALYTSARNGAWLAEGAPDDLPSYTGASGREYWGWRDQHHCTPGELAKVFLSRHAEIAKLGYGEDWLYAGWYQHMLRLTYPDALPIGRGDYQEFEGCLITIPGERRIALPPPGYASDARP
jgi:hypothetical protein